MSVEDVVVKVLQVLPWLGVAIATLSPRGREKQLLEEVSQARRDAARIRESRDRWREHAQSTARELRAVERERRHPYR